MEDLRLDQLPGVGPVTTKKLSDAGIHSIMDLIVRGPVELAEISGMDKDTAANIVEKARQALVEGGMLAKDFVSATEIYKRRQEIGRITTGTECFDLLFDGGVETQALTEVYGEFGSGKTQFCHTMCVTVQKPKEEGGLEGTVLYIDSENTFRPERIVSIAKAHGMDPEKVLDKIIVARAYNSAHQTLILEEASQMIQENNIKLLVVDSAVGLFRSEYLGRGTLSERQQRLNKFVHLLDPTRPIGGNVVAHTSTYRIYFKKSGKKRIARMVDSPHHPEQEVIFGLGEAGVIDPDSETKKKTTKATKSKAEPEVKAEPKTDSVDADAKIEDIPEDSE